MQFDLLEAKNQLSQLVQAALRDEDVVIANNGVPAVRMVKIEPQKANRQPGAWKELPPASEDWDTPETNEAIAQELENGTTLI